MQSEREDGINHSIIARDASRIREFSAPRDGREPRLGKVNHKSLESIAFHMYTYIFCMWSLSGYGPHDRGPVHERHEHGEIRDPLSKEPLGICAGLCTYILATCVRVRMHCVCIHTCERECAPSRNVVEPATNDASRSRVPRNSSGPDEFLPPGSRSRYGCRTHAAVKVLYLAVTRAFFAVESSERFFFFFFRYDSAY